MGGAIVQAGTGAHAVYLGLTERWHRDYAARHGLAYHAHYERALPAEVPAQWDKVPLLLGLLEAGHDPVVWLDADVCVRDPSRDVSRACPAGLGMVYQDAAGHHYNSGVMVCRNEPAVLAVLRRVLRFAGRRCPGTGLHDQPFLNRLGRDVIARIGAEWNHRDGYTRCADPALVAGHGMPHARRVELIARTLPPEYAPPRGAGVDAGEREADR